MAHSAVLRRMAGGRQGDPTARQQDAGHQQVARSTNRDPGESRGMTRGVTGSGRLAWTSTRGKKFWDRSLFMICLHV